MSDKEFKPLKQFLVYVIDEFGMPTAVRFFDSYRAQGTFIPQYAHEVLAACVLNQDTTPKRESILYVAELAAEVAIARIENDPFN